MLKSALRSTGLVSSFYWFVVVGREGDLGYFWHWLWARWVRIIYVLYWGYCWSSLLAYLSFLFVGISGRVIWHFLICLCDISVLPPRLRLPCASLPVFPFYLILTVAPVHHFYTQLKRHHTQHRCTFSLSSTLRRSAQYVDPVSDWCSRGPLITIIHIYIDVPL